MGNTLDRTYSTEDEGVGSSSKRRKKDTKKKRNRSRKEDSDDEGPSVKVAKLDTVKYVHERLFINGENSDVTVVSCGRSWHLHRLYLEQCDYFKALLNGEWKESKKQELHLDYSEDSNLTAEAHNTRKTRGNSFNMMKHNFYKLMALENREYLMELHEDVLLKLLSSTDLLFTEGELDLYRFVKTWLFVQADPSSIALSKEEFVAALFNFITSYEPGILFLEHAPIFAALRLHSLTVDSKRIEELEKDNLIPKEVLRDLIIDQWKMMLQNEEDPTLIKKLSSHDFALNSVRCGRVVEEFNKCWRWLGYNNGVDINVYINERIIIANSEGELICDTGDKSATLQKNESMQVCVLPHNVKLPITVHINYLTSMPPQPSFIYVGNYAKLHGTQTDLDKLDAIRKEIPRDNSRDRHRVEDDPDLDREPIYSESGELLSSIAPESGKSKNLTGKVDKIKELPEISRKIRQTQEKSHEQSDNPFEEIATRPPLNQRNLFRQVKNRLSNERRHRHKHKERFGFLTRDDIIKSHKKTTTTTPFPKLVDSDEVELEKNERLGGRMDQEQSKNLKVRPINVPENALQPLSNRYEASDGLMRLRNNPYSEVELGKGNIFMLPVPPDNV
ncbi:hypothetical protein WR25_19678 [Diploscapter pachys]|uniref:BTB domain-containing protein n=1 Tax=Diploscapter pachys TaxID=2018661 RepID=A0A2A2JVL8_9BILA|nr:hypothetical protein WR25_19678 [Diploscapter pachys]